MSAPALRSLRAAERREQILDAASVCFAKDGFHAATIAQISHLAGMSPGHIYHFFENKEAIVSGIVQRMTERWLGLMQPYPTGQTVATTLAERVNLGIRERTREDFVGLWLEVLAEAARNSTLARAVHATDQQLREAMIEQIGQIRRMLGIETETPLGVIADVILALYEGLTNRSVSNLDFDANRLEAVLFKTTRAALEA
ncbi:MAG: TetR/AcrR family transcriptional regulator [Gammaproteobacteria bacterium]